MTVQTLVEDQRRFHARVLCTCVCGICTGLLAVPIRGAEIKSVPERDVWIADGTTECKVNVWVDNTGLDGEPTDGAQWRLINTPVLDYVAGSSGPPTSNDFFEGMPMFWEIFLPPGGLSARIVTEIGGGPIDHTGNVGEYRFTVPLGMTPGTYSFDLNSTALMSAQGDPQPHDVIIEPFDIVAPPTFAIGASIIDTTTGLPVSEVRADGTQYKALITADTTDDPVFAISGVAWDASFPEEHFVFDGAQAPTQNDFFDGYPTNDTLAQVVTGGELVGNARTTVDQGQGPSNKAGSLEEILFTVRFDVPWTSGSMAANEVQITDTEGNTFTSADLGGNNIAIQSQGYSIVRPDTEVAISTELPQTVLVADGTAQYEVVVRTDTTTFPGQHFNLSGWDVVVPTYLTITGAELPAQGDFYAGYPTNDTLAQEVTGGELAGNLRETQNAADGPGSVKGALETIHFTVNTGAPPGIDTFDLNDVRFRDTGMNDYRSPDSGNGVVIQNASFTIVPWVLPDVNHDGYVNLGDFSGFPDCMTGPDVPPTGECTDYDFDGDSDVDGMDFIAFQACFTGDTTVSDPACAVQ